MAEAQPIDLTNTSDEDDPPPKRQREDDPPPTRQPDEDDPSRNNSFFFSGRSSRISHEQVAACFAHFASATGLGAASARFAVGVAHLTVA